MLDSDYKRLCWASRRGMLELDLMLVPFVEQQFPKLEEADQRIYWRLMECEDTELFAWLLNKDQASDPELARMVKQIIEFSKPT